MRTFVALLAAAIVACSPSHGTQAAARVGDGHVRDAASIVSPEAEQRIDAELATLEAATSDQVGVVTVTNLAGQPIERFSLDYARRWKLGRKDLDNGVLILIAPKEHKMRIEVGTGLEGLLTDQRAAGIVGQMVAPFKRGDYDAGIELGVGAITSLLMADRKRPQRKLVPVRNAA